MTRLAHRAFAHRADLLAALVYLCLGYLSFNALADYANAHQLFPEPQGGWAFAVAVDGTVLYAFISFKRAPRLARLLLVSGAAATYTLQRWHAEGAPHPLVVAGVVPGAMVLVTFAWHRIREGEARWDPLPPPPPHEVDQPDEPEVDHPDQDQPDQPTTSDLPVHPKVVARANGSAFTATQLGQIRRWVAEERSVRFMAQQLGLNDGERNRKLTPLVRSLKGELVRSKKAGS